MRKLQAPQLPLVILLCLLCSLVCAQDSSSLYGKIYNFPDKFFGSISSRSKKLEGNLTKQTEKYLTRLARHEKKLQKKLWKKDSTAAKELFGDVDGRYGELRLKLADANPASKLRNVYSGHMDSMKTALSFLNENKLLQQTASSQSQLNNVMKNYSGLQEKLNSTDLIKKYLQQRQSDLKSHLEKFGFTKQYRKFQKDVYYYRAHIDEYKKALEDPQKLETRLLELANKIPAFRNFFAKHSELGSLFRLPGSNDPLAGATASIAGLQTRAMVQQDLQQRFGTGVNINQVVQQNVQSAQSQVSQLKNTISGIPTSIGGKNGEFTQPDFKPNNQKTKSFFDRVELGTNFQSTKSNSFFPVTTDIGLSAGYKLNDKSIVGIGASYKLGWGKDIRHIDISHQGVGLRSFIDWKLKGSFWISGGMELNYKNEFQRLAVLEKYSAWQKSGLIGLSKVVSLQSNFFKKTKVQLLWDFLSHHQIPRNQPVVFRVGYGFK